MQETDTRSLEQGAGERVQVLVAEEDTVSVGQEVFVVDQSAQGGGSGEATPAADPTPAAPKKEAPKKEAPKQGQEAQAAKPAPKAAPPTKAAPPPPQPKGEVTCSSPHSLAVISQQPRDQCMLARKQV